MQRANLALKSKIKQLEEIISQDQGGILDYNYINESCEGAPAMPEPKVPSNVTTQADLEMEETGRELETMEMVPIGKIEEVAKKEFREARRQSRSRMAPPTDEYQQQSRRPYDDNGPLDRSNNGHGGRGHKGQQPKEERW